LKIIGQAVWKLTNAADNTHDPPAGVIVDAPRRDVHDVEWDKDNGSDQSMKQWSGNDDACHRDK
jgi:hypothetical protein